jgi:hypothetical protein
VPAKGDRRSPSWRITSFANTVAVQDGASRSRRGARGDEKDPQAPLSVVAKVSGDLLANAAAVYRRADRRDLSRGIFVDVRRTLVARP